MKNQNVHPIHILYSVIALTVVVWSVLYYQVKHAPPSVVIQEEISPPAPTGISQEERARVVAELNAQTASSLSAADREKLQKEMSKPGNNPTISAEERARVEQELSNN